MLISGRHALGCAVGALQVLPPGIYIAMNGQIAPAVSVEVPRGQGGPVERADLRPISSPALKVAVAPREGQGA